MEYFNQLAYIAMVLLLGTLASVLAYALNTSHVFIVLLTGMVFGKLGLITFDSQLISIVSTIALIFAVFSGSTRFKYKEIKEYLPKAGRLNITYFLLCSIVLTFSVIALFNLEYNMNSILLGLLFSNLAYATDPSGLLSLFKGKKNKFAEIIEIESIINDPVTIILGLLVLTSLGSPQVKIFESIGTPIISFTQAIAVGLLFGAAIGYFITHALKNNYFGELTNLAILTSAIITYIGAEYCGGSGVLAVALYGLMFGNSHIPHLIEMEKFESVFTSSINILTFMMLGTIIVILPEYILKGTLIFIIILVVRFFAVWISFMKEKISVKQILFMTLQSSKGLDVAILLLIIISQYSNVENINVIINLTMIMILYSIALSSIMLQFSSYFLGKKESEK